MPRCVEQDRGLLLGEEQGGGEADAGCAPHGCSPRRDLPRGLGPVPRLLARGSGGKATASKQGQEQQETVNWRTLAFLFSLVLPAGSCDLPQDPEGSLRKALTRGSLRVGIDDGGAATHDEERSIVDAFAAGRRLAVRWVRGPLPRLLEQLERFELDIVVSGLRPDHPWRQRVGTSATWQGEDRQAPHCLVVAPGENRLLTELDRFVLRRAEPARR